MIMKLFASIILYTLCGIIFGFPYQKVSNQNPEELGGYFQGDMILTPEQMAMIKNDKSGVQLVNGLIDPKYRWPNNTVDYVISGNFKIQLVSCLKFNEHQNKTGLTIGYVDVVNNEPGCSSAVGYSNKKRTLNLGNGCATNLAVIMHEFLHALGFHHMQSTYDRDDYVTILYENICPCPEILENFEKYPENVVTDFGVSYDYNSVMHYSACAFSKNCKPTIVPKDPNAKIGQRLGLSFKDILKLNIMYNCISPYKT